MLSVPWLKESVKLNPLQPATALWRAIELELLARTCQESLPATGDLVVLDAGCGDGSSLRLLKAHLPALGRVIGVDLDAREAALAQRSGVYDSILVCDGAALPLRDGTCDVVIANSSLEHVPRARIAAVLREIGRAVKPAGRVMLTVPSIGFHRVLRGPRLFKHLGYTRERYLEYLDRRLQHYYYWSQEEWRTQLSAVGLYCERALEYLNAREVRAWELLSNATAGVCCRLGLSARPLDVLYAMRLRRPRYPAWLGPAVFQILRAFTGHLTGMAQPDSGYGGLLIVARKSMDDRAARPAKQR